MVEFDYLGARKAGASDEEIQSFLKANGTDFDLVGAKKAGATDNEISSFLNSQPVKKKEVTQPTTQNSKAGTQNTSLFNSNLTLPSLQVNPTNKQIIGTKEPVKPQINLKSIQEEKKFLNSRQKPQVFEDYNTVIQQGIKGQNKFDNTLQTLSKPIVEQQAKKEVQQLQKQQQAKKEASKDTRENILAVIPELAQAKNTNEAVSTILKSDMRNNLNMWQQFDDEALLGNDEATLNDFLVSKGLKNQDRELYVKQQAQSNPKYDYEYKRNQIGSLYKAVAQRVDDYDVVLKQKFGDDFYKQAASGNQDILNNEDFNKYQALKQRQVELSSKGNTLIDNPEFSDVKKQRDEVEKAQQGVDERAKNDKWYKFGDELNYVGNKLAYGAGHVVKMIAELPALATSFNKGYDTTDKLADWGNRFSDNLIDAIPVSSDKKTGFLNRVANVDGYKVFIGDDGQPTDVRDKNNFRVPNDVSKGVLEKFDANPTNYKINNERNLGSLVDNGLNTMIDMGVMILGTKGAGILGAGEKMQKLTSMGIAFQQTKRDVFNDAIKKGLDPRNADILSTIIGTAAGTSSMVNPMEFNIASGQGLFSLLKTDGLNAAKLALIKDGKLSVKEYAKEFFKGGVKNTMGETIEELGIENTTQAIANNHFNNSISETDKINGGLDDNLHILDKQGLETFLVVAGSSLLMTPIEIKSQTQLNQQEAIKMAIENPEDFAKIKALQVKKGMISQEQSDNETKVYNDVSKTYNAIKEDVKEELQPQLLTLLTKKFNLNNKISEIKDEVLSKPYKDQLEQINQGIESISNGKNASEDLVAPIQQSEILAESTAKDGSSTVTKVETDIANKINKGQDLTPEEQDYYNASKESIDKLVSINKSPIVPINETVEVEKKEIVLPPPTPQVVAPAELDEQQITEQLNEVLNDKTTPTPLVNTEQEQNISERLPSEYQNNQGVQQIDGIGQDVSNESEVQQIQQGQEVDKELVDKKAIITELESNPNSPFHKLVDIDALRKEVADAENLSTKAVEQPQVVKLEKKQEEKSTLNPKEKQDLVKSLSKEQVKEFVKLKSLPEKESYLISIRDKTLNEKQTLDNNTTIENTEVVNKKTVEVGDNNTQTKVQKESVAEISPNKKISADEVSVIAEKEVEREINHIVKTSSQKRAGLAEKNKLLKKQKETLLADLIKASEILLEQEGNNNDRVRGLMKDNIATREAFLPETLTKETIAQLKELGIVVSTEKAKYNSELDKLKIDIVDDGSIKIPQRGIFDVIEMIEKEFPTEIKDTQYKQSTTPPKVSKNRYYTIAQDYNSIDIPKKKFEDAKDNLETAKKSGNKKLIEVMQENLNEAKAIYDIAKDLDYTELNTQKEVQKSKPIQGFADATDIENSGISKRDIYDAYKVFNKAIPTDVNKSTIEDVIATVFANNLRKQEKSITDKQTELAKKKLEVDVILDKYKLKNGLGYKKPTTNSAVFELNRALRDLAQIEYESDFLKDNSKEINKLLGEDDVVIVTEDIKENPINKIEDIGEKIGGAKKDLSSRLSNVTTKDIESQPLSKSFPEPNYKELVNEGVITKDEAIFLKYLYDNIPSKPRKSYRLASWVSKVQNAIDTVKGILGSETLKKELLNGAVTEKLGENYKKHKEILEAFGFPETEVNLGGYEITKDYSRGNYMITKGNFIIKSGFETINDAVIALKINNSITKNKEKQVKFSVYKNTETGEFYIGKKGATSVVKIMGGIPQNIKEAHQYLKENQEKFESIWNGMKNNPNERRFENRTRVGTDWRNGENISGDKFIKTFGFRGVEFGNWVNNSERQQSVNDAYDALMDMANLLGISPNAVSLNGELGFAFGARGSGKASAHYESGKVVINLTKTKGAGSLGHEWFHALDNYFSRVRGYKSNFITDSPVQYTTKDGQKDKSIRVEVLDKFKDLTKVIRNSGLPKRSRELDKTRSQPYWSTTIEMGARAFENFIIEKLAKNNETNDYLANFKETSEWINDSGGDIDATKNYPYPLETESESINKAFQDLFDTIQERKEDDKSILFSIENESTNKQFTPIQKSKFNELLDKLKKAFPNVKVELFGKNDFENAKKELEANGIKIQDIQTKDGTIYGFKTPDGKVFLNSDAINANTPIHEFGHVWQSVFPNEFAKGISLLVQSPQGRELINEIRKNPAYKGKSITEIQAEALVTAIGNKGENIFNSNPTLYNKFKQWLNDLFAKIGDKLGIKNLSPDDKFDMFTKKVVGELLGGKVLDSKVGTEKSTSTQHSIDITPEMKAMVELGQPLFQFKPDELTKKVQELRDFELNDEEIRDYLLEAGNTKQQIDDALGVKEVDNAKDETKKELSDSKQRVAERIVLGNGTLNAVKEHIVQQGYDKSDYDSKQIFKDVDELINKFGIEKAESFIDKIGDVGLSEPHKVVLQHKIAEYYGNKANSDENLTEEERKEAMFKSAQLFLDLSKQRTDAGRGNAILAQIYLDSDIYFTLPMFEHKMNAIGAQLSSTERAELENLSKEIADLRKENTKLQELAKKEAEQQTVDDITTHLLVDDLIIDSKIKDDLEVKNAKSILAKGFEDIARMLSSIAMAQQVDKVKFKDTILDMTKATMTISKIGVKKALKSVLKAIKNANPNIEQDLLTDAEKHVLSQIKDTDTGIKKKNKEGISRDELLELIEQGADTMDKMVEAIRDKYYDGDKTISDKQIRDEITNYGESIRQSQTEVEEKLSEIKSLMLLQSKLEDAENNVAPKKTGLIRDKDKITVREKRRELAEAMKKLTVTLSQDDIAGLNERKLTQIANKIEEVQKVLDGYEKIKNKANFDYNDAVKKKQQELDDLMASQEALLHYSKESLTNLITKYQERLDKKQYSKNPTLNKLSITDTEHQKLKNQLEAKKEQLKSERDNFRNNNADFLLENKQKQIDRQIAEIDKLLAGIKVRKTSEQIKAERDRKSGVINSSTNQTALDKLKENQAILEAKKEQWERKVIQKEVEIEKAKQTWLQKIGINAIAVSRTLTLGLTDIGWLGVQGGYFARTKPHLFAKALNESMKGKLSEEAFNQWKRDLKSNPFYETMINAGLRIPSQNLKDEVFEQEFRESGFTKLLGKNNVTDIVNKNGRLSVKFLANLRIQVFQKMYDGLTPSQKADKEVLAKLADYVNSRSGSGGVIGENKNGSLNKWWGLLTSARNTSAMLQQTYIGMLYSLTKNYDRNKPLNNQPMVVRQIVGDVLNQAVLFSGSYLSYLVESGLSGDDDEWYIETSPFSTSFLKLKNKDGSKSYFDMGGTTALNVATLRLLTTITNTFGTDFDNFKNYDGTYSKIGLKEFSSKTGLQILAESIFNRTLSLLAPFKNPMVAKSDKDGNYSMYGQKYTPTEFRVKMLTDMLIPMNLPNIYNDITDEDVGGLNVVVNTILNAIGISNSNQKYDKKGDSKAPQVNSVPVNSKPIVSRPIK